jgi:hypothetical protein
MVTINPTTDYYLSPHEQPDTGVLPVEHGQVIELNTKCLKIHVSGANMVRGVTTGLLLASMVTCFMLDLAANHAFGVNNSFVHEYIVWISNHITWIAPLILFDLILWPIKPPVVLDRTSRTLIFKTCFRTHKIAWDGCLGILKHFITHENGVLHSGHMLYIKDITSDHDPNKLSHVFILNPVGGINDHQGFWEYLRLYMDYGAGVVPEPKQRHRKGILQTSLNTLLELFPLKDVCIRLRNPKSFWSFLEGIFIVYLSILWLIMCPLIYPILLMHTLSMRIGMTCRYPKDIRLLCNRDKKSTIKPTPLPISNKLLIHIDGKPLEVDWPVDQLKPPTSTEPPLKEGKWDATIFHSKNKP